MNVCRHGLTVLLMLGYFHNYLLPASSSRADMSCSLAPGCIMNMYISACGQTAFALFDAFLLSPHCLHVSRYFAEASASLMLNIYGTRVRKDTSGNKMFDYYVSDGIYGSLNCIVYDHANPSISWLRDPSLAAVPEEDDKTVFR